MLLSPEILNFQQLPLREAKGAGKIIILIKLIYGHEQLFSRRANVVPKDLLFTFVTIYIV